MLKAIFFDLDGTLLPLNEDLFIKVYFRELAKKLYPLGYESNKLIDVIWKGTILMMQNDGSKTNEEVFWSYFKERYGEEKLNDKEYIDSFYTNEFKETIKVCKENPYVKDILKFCKDNNLITILSTNPIFPKQGTLTRMSYIGLNESDFDYVTTYEDSRYCKPNPMYFKTLLEKFNLQPEEVLVFGNNTYEDGDCSKACDIKCYMVGDFIIKSDKAKYHYEHINMDEVISTIRQYFN